MLKITRKPPIAQPVEEIELQAANRAPDTHRLILCPVGERYAGSGLPRYIRVAEFQAGKRNSAVYDLTADEVDEFTTALREMAGLS